MRSRNGIEELEGVLDEIEQCFALAEETPDPYVREHLCRMAQNSFRRAKELAIGLGWRRAGDRVH